MTDDESTTREIAKAVQETAKAVPAVIEAGSDLAKWFGGVLGTVPEDVVGLVIGDLLHELRIRNADRLRRKTYEILRARGVDKPPRTTLFLVGGYLRT